MGKLKETRCPECGEASVKAFVQYGSFFTRCTACEYDGPATSWLALAPQLGETVRANLIDENFQELTCIGEGRCTDLFSVISKAAEQGKLVMLSSTDTAT